MIGVLKVIEILIGLAICVIAVLKWLVIFVPIVVIFFSSNPGVAYIQVLIGVGIVAIIIFSHQGENYLYNGSFNE